MNWVPPLCTMGALKAEKHGIRGHPFSRCSVASPSCQSKATCCNSNRYEQHSSMHRRCATCTQAGGPNHDTKHAPQPTPRRQQQMAMPGARRQFSIDSTIAQLRSESSIVTALVPKASTHVVQVELLRDVPGFWDLVVKRYPWMRDEDAEQISNEMLAALKLPVHPLLSPCLLFGGNATHGFCLSSYGGGTIDQLQQQLQEFEQLVIFLKSDMKPQVHQTMMQQLQQKRVKLFLCLLVCMLLAIETFQSLGVDCVYRDWKGPNVVWDAEQQLFKLIDFGYMQSLAAADMESFSDAGTLGIHDTRAFVSCDKHGRFTSQNLIYTEAMKPLCDRTTDVCLALLPALQFLNGTLPGPYEQCRRELRCHSTHDTAMDRLAQQLPAWLANLTRADPTFDLLRNSYPHLVDCMIAALSPVTSQRPSIKQWVALPELAPMVWLVQQRVAAAMPDVQQKTAALSSLRAAVAPSSSPGANWQQWKQQRGSKGESLEQQQQQRLKQAARMEQLQQQLLRQTQQQQQQGVGEQVLWRQQQQAAEAARREAVLRREVQRMQALQQEQLLQRELQAMQLMRQEQLLQREMLQMQQAVCRAAEQ